MKNIEYFNNIIKEVIIDIDNLIVEQSVSVSGYDALGDRSVSDADKIQTIIDVQNQKPPQNPIKIEEIYKDMSNGKWPDGFPSQSELEQHFQNTTNTTYTIEDGKYKGKQLTSGVYDALRISRGIKSAKSRVRSGQKKKGKGHASVCYCVRFARQFLTDPDDLVEEENKCPQGNKSACMKKWEDDLNAWLPAQNEYTKNLTEEYRLDCISRYKNEMFDLDTRNLYVHNNPNITNTPYCEKWDNDIKDLFDGIESDLSGLLSKFFRVKNQKQLKVNANKGSVSDKLIVYSNITIKYENRPTDYNDSGTGVPPRENNTTFPTCVANSSNIKKGDEVKYEVMTASPLNKGKTVQLKDPDGKYLLITFSSTERGENQNGNLKFCDSNGKPVCSQIGWNGKITRLEM